MLFVVGNSRSGTTMTARILGRHSAVYTFQELHYVEQLVPAPALLDSQAVAMDKGTILFATMLRRARLGLWSKQPLEEFEQEAKRLVSSPLTLAELYESALVYESRRLGKVIPCEQTPRNVFAIAELLQAYPNAYVINLVRDPRDVLASQKNKWRRRFLGAKNIPLSEALRAWVNYHPITLAKLWVSAVSAAKGYQQHERVMTLRYEDLVASPEAVVRSVCEFSGLEFEADMLNVRQVGSSTSADGAATGINASRVGGWRALISAGELAACEREAGTLMQEFGYEPVSEQGPRARVGEAYQTVKWPFQLVLAVIFNLHRAKNMVGAISRRLISKAS